MRPLGRSGTTLARGFTELSHNIYEALILHPQGSTSGSREQSDE
jgi:hypothetical protein